MDKICAICGKSFTQMNGPNKYCSSECTSKARWKHDHKWETPDHLWHGTCIHCGAEFASNHQRKYCSDECIYQQGLDNEKSKRIKEAHICAVCGKEFYGGQNRKCCSHECSDTLKWRKDHPAWNREKAIQPITNSVMVNRIAKLYPTLEYVGGYIGECKYITVRCKICGCEFQLYERAARKKYEAQCPQCKADKEKAEQEEAERIKLIHGIILLIKQRVDYLCDVEYRTRVCAVCGRVFMAERTVTGNKYCSDACRNKIARRYSHMYSKRRRAKYEGNKENIYSEELYKKNNGTCYLCGKQCLYDDHTIIDGAFIAGDRYPTIEHIIPLSKGGKHTWDNVGLACMKCNREKRDLLLS